MSTDRLVQFLEARLGEDEQAARAATDGNWVVDRPILTDGTTTDISAEDTTCGYSSVTTDHEGFGSCSLADAAHIARHDPARVLADVAAKRAILTAYVTERARRDAYQAETARAVEDAEQASRRRCAAARCRGLEIAVEVLAQPYAAHADFDPAWKIDN